MPPVIHITYATPSFSQAAHLLRRSARRFGIAETRCYTPEHPALREAWQNQPEIMGSRRGAGYWLWKAYIIEDALRSAQDGTAVLYTDAALTFIADPKVMIELAEEHPTCLFSLKKAQLSSKWTKRDCFIEMDADTPEFWNLPILMGGVQLYRGV